MGSVLKWPIIGWIVIDVLFILILYVDGVSHVMSPTTVAPLALAFGLWVGYRTVQGGGSFSNAIVNGAIVGAVCGVLTLLMGAVHGMDSGDVFAQAVFFFGLHISGAVVGGGFLLSSGAQASAAAAGSRGVGGGDGGGSGGGGGM
ncbi:MAG: hypothetical protein ABFS14_12575 [Gemmatimonadota bacterium]